MNHTPQIKKAIQFAARKHHGQFRKETEPLPYITHLISVALLVAEDGAHDDVVTAALLHDVIEDTNTTREEIVDMFNERVAAFVEAVTEPSEKNGIPLSWKERKILYLDRLARAPVEAVQIAAADKIDNIESKLDALEKEGRELLSRWKQPVEEYVWYHNSVLTIAEERLTDHPLTRRLRDIHAKEKERLTKL